MDDWSEIFLKNLEVALNELNDFWQDLEVSLVVTADLLETELTKEWELFHAEWIQPLFAEDWWGEAGNHDSEPDSEGENIPDSYFGLVPYRSATPQHHPACMGCRHYHGFVHEGNLLVCAMHPYGVEEEHCPDWEGQKP